MQEGEFDFAKALVGKDKYLLKIALKFTRGNKPDALDLVQETMLKAWKHRGTYVHQNECTLCGWLATILKHLVYSQKRKGKIECVELMPEQEEVFRAPVMTEARRVVEEVQEVMKTCPLVYGPECFEMIVEELSYEEMAERARVPIGTIKSRCGRTRAFLRGFDLGLP